MFCGATLYNCVVILNSFAIRIVDLKPDTPTLFSKLLVIYAEAR